MYGPPPPAPAQRILGTHDAAREQRADETGVQTQQNLLTPLGHQQTAVGEVIVVHRDGVEYQVERRGGSLHIRRAWSVYD